MNDVRVMVLDDCGRQVGPSRWVSSSSAFYRGQIVTLTLGGNARQFRVRDAQGDTVLVVEVDQSRPRGSAKDPSITPSTEHREGGKPQPFASPRRRGPAPDSRSVHPSRQ